jgi:putative tryptophan/tyrosine transport system substrate-binding protein
MRRREFITLLGGTATAWPIIAGAQKSPTRLGFLSAGSAGSRTTAAQIVDIHRGLKDNGMIEGRDYVLETRFAAGHYDRFPALANELAQAGVSVVLVNTISAVRAAQALTPPISIVMLSINDPVGTGLVASLARPGGHTTGMATLNEDVTAKILEFQHMVVPKGKVIAVLFNPVNPTNPPMVDDLTRGSEAMGMKVVPFVLRSPEDLDFVLATVAGARVDAIHLVGDSGNLDLGDRIADFSIEHRLPFFTSSPRVVEFGALLAYGASLGKLFIRSGYFIKRILDGANPGDLPVEQPTQIELWINLKTAGAIGVEIPLQLQQLAERLIE